MFVKQSFGDFLLDFFYQVHCVGCQKPNVWLCDNCSEKLELVETPLCPVCQRPAIGGFTHPFCQKRHTPERLIILYRYRSPLSDLLKALKYRKYHDVRRALRGPIREGLERTGLVVGEDAWIVPVPLHPWRQYFKRGFNQAEIIGQLLAEVLDLPVRPEVLKRVVYTLYQTRLSGEERQENVAGAFAVPQSCQKEIKGQDIILVDDVFTTGATSREAAETLKKAGARYVYLFALAKSGYYKARS